MMTQTRVVSALLVMVLLGGPLATLSGAQQPAPPPAPSTQPPAPDLFQESLKAERASGQGSGLYAVGAVVTNIFLVPGRALTCGLGAVVGVGVLAATLGTGYRAATAVWHEGCGGKWAVSGDDLRPDSTGGRQTDWDQR
jgi:hypothetical protein